MKPIAFLRGSVRTEYRVIIRQIPNARIIAAFETNPASANKPSAVWRREGEVGEMVEGVGSSPSPTRLLGRAAIQRLFCDVHFVVGNGGDVVAQGRRPALDSGDHRVDRSREREVRRRFHQRRCFNQVRYYSIFMHVDGY